METIKSLDKKLAIDEQKFNSETWIFNAHLKNKYCECPHCHNSTKSVHSVHLRTLQDLPIQNQTVYLKVKVRHMICRKCGTIFTESLSFASDKAHMTDRLREHIMITAAPNSSLIACKQLEKEGIIVKKSTICALLKKRRTY